MGEQKIINYCDFLYNKEGHFDDDFALENFYANGKLHHVQVNLKDIKNPVKKIICLKDYLYKSDAVNIIATVSFVYLFLYSVLYRQFDYKMIIHHIPTRHVWLYRIILNVLINKCSAVAVFHECVRDDLYQRCFIKKEIQIIHTKYIRERMLKKGCLNVKKILLIGAYSASIKDFATVFNAINAENFNMIQFVFYCKGVSSLSFENSRNNNIAMYDEYPDKNTYSSEIESADFVLLPYKKEYGVRYSGILFDALSFSTPVIATDIACLRVNVQKYRCGLLYTDVNSLIMHFRAIDEGKVKIDIADSLYEDYSIAVNKKLFEIFLSETVT